MFLNHVDLLSPKITFYYSGRRGHTSKVSGLLTIICCLGMISVFLFFFADIILDNPKTLMSYKAYESHPGFISIDDTNLFHYLVLQGDLIYDPKAISIIGVQINQNDVLQGIDEKKKDYWRYSYCDFENLRIRKVENFVNEPQGLCIKEYYNHTTAQTISSNDTEFQHPVINHGTANRNYIPYIIVLQGCQNSTEDSQCYSSDFIDEYLDKLHSLKMNILNYYVDLENHKNPFYQYFHSIEIGIYKSAVLSTDFHFNPTYIKTYKGLLFDDISITEQSTLTETIRGTFEGKNDSLIGMLTFWMHNQINVYERRYTKLYDIVGDVSGISKFLYLIFYLINFIYNRFIVYQDFCLSMKSLTEKRKNISIKGRFRSNSCLKFQRTSLQSASKNKVDIYLLFQKPRITFGQVFKYHFCFSVGSYVKTLTKVRKKILSEENMFKSYLFKKALKRTLLPEKTATMNPTLVNTLVEGEIKKSSSPEKGDLNNSNNDLISCCLKDKKDL